MLLIEIVLGEEIWISTRNCICMYIYEKGNVTCDMIPMYVYVFVFSNVFGIKDTCISKGIFGIER